MARSYIEQATGLLAGCTESGTGFFALAAEALALGSGCKWALICQLQDDAATVGSLAFWKDGALADPLSYEIASGPCAALYRGNQAPQAPIFHSDVAATFPAFPLLQEMAVRSYHGVAFANAEESPLVMSSRWMTDHPIKIRKSMPSSAWWPAGSGRNFGAGRRNRPWAPANCTCAPS
jgi:hypothetical protein